MMSVVPVGTMSSPTPNAELMIPNNDRAWFR